MIRLRSALAAAGMVCFSAALIGCSSPSGAQALSPSRATAADTTAASSVVSPLPDFASLVERWGPSIVNVDVTQKNQVDASNGGGSGSDPSADFFRRFGIPAPNFGQPNAQPARAEGSGFIVSPDGYILTNAHVVAQADSVTVRLTDRREFQGKVVGSDERTDIAVIKIDARGLPAVKIGDPSKLRPGEWVLAIGSTFGFENSATAGIVSATARTLSNGYVPFIQTDVAVNPGNSGGPLFNLRGEVVGVNSQIFSRTGGYMGLSFAIPIDVAASVQGQLIKTGHVVRGRIGVFVQEVNAQLASSFGLDRPRGALVSSVQSDSPAEKGGVKPGDVVLSVDGQPIEHSSELAGRIASMKPGSEVTVQVWREQKARDLKLGVAELKEEPTLTAKADEGSSPNAPRLGLAARPMTPEEKQQANTDGTLVVEGVTGPAAAAGVRPGDIVLGVNGKRVKSLSELQAAASKAGKSVALLIQREDSQIFVPLQLG